MKFTELELDPQLLEVINKIGYENCTEIQEKAIPHILAGKDIAGLSQTGTGKTATFVIPLIDRILKSQKNGEWHNRYYHLILVPTRELAEQVEQAVQKYGGDLNIKSMSIYGGTSYDKQKSLIATGVDFVVATPGRLIDLYKEHVLDLKQVKSITFDEADRMFDMGFKDDMKYILQRVPTDRQFLVFSATLNFEVLNTAYEVGANPIEISIGRDQPKAENVTDQILHVGSDDKPQYLLSLLKIHNPTQAIVFCNFKHHIDKVVRFLNDNQVPAVGISSLLTQAQRNNVIEQFKHPKGTMVLVATDVAARGLDIKGVDVVFNYDLPNDSESYVHRIGRTGRAGMTGLAFSLVGEKDVDALPRIEEYLKGKITAGWVEDNTLIKDFIPMKDNRDNNFRKPFKKDFNSKGDRPQRGGFDKDRGPRRDGPRKDYPKKDFQKDAQGGERKPFKKDFNRTDAPTENKKPNHFNTKQADYKGRDAEGLKSTQSMSKNKPAQANGKPYVKSQNNGARPNQFKKKVPYRPNAAPSKTLGKKISGFFKKLFS